VCGHVPHACAAAMVGSALRQIRRASVRVSSRVARSGESAPANATALIERWQFPLYTSDGSEASSTTITRPVLGVRRRGTQIARDIARSRSGRSWWWASA